MVIDTSALVSIILEESSAAQIVSALLASSDNFLSAGSYFETLMVLQSRKCDAGLAELHQIMTMMQIEIVDFSGAQAELAHEAFRTYGKGRHPAGLNFGDCMAYALAKDRGEPLLFKGQDFPLTDVTPVPY